MTAQTQAVGVTLVIDRSELQYQAMVLLSKLVKFNDTWLSTQAQLVKQLLDIWTSDAFVLRHAKVVSQRGCPRSVCLLLWASEGRSNHT